MGTKKIIRTVEMPQPTKLVFYKSDKPELFSDKEWNLLKEIVCRYDETSFFECGKKIDIRTLRRKLSV